MIKRTVLAALFAMAANTPSPAAAGPAWRYGLLRPALPETAAPGDRGGVSVAQDGKWLLIGAPNAEVQDLAASGQVSVFHWESGRWERKSSLTLNSMRGGTTPQTNARFGASVAIHGTRALIGCPGCAAPNPHAYLVELADPFIIPVSWYPLYPALISTPDAELGTGAAVEIHGNMVAVAAPNARSSSGGVERGAVALGHFDGSAVIWDDILFGPSNPQGSRFGHALAMTTTSGSSLFNGRRSLLVGAPTYVNSGTFGLAGRAYLFDQGSFGAGPWNYVREFANDNPGFADALGWSVAMEQASIEVHGLIALGAPGRSMNGSVGGSARVYLRPIGEESDWFFDEEFTYPDAEDGDRFGVAIDLAGDRVLVGADHGTVGAYSDRGGAYLYERDFDSPGSTWEHVQWLPCFAAGAEHECGMSLSLSPSMAIVGHPKSYDEKGGATVFVCDQIFAHAMEGDAVACTLP